MKIFSFIVIIIVCQILAGDVCKATFDQCRKVCEEHPSNVCVLNCYQEYNDCLRK